MSSLPSSVENFKLIKSSRIDIERKGERVNLKCLANQAKCWTFCNYRNRAKNLIFIQKRDFNDLETVMKQKLGRKSFKSHLKSQSATKSLFSPLRENVWSIKNVNFDLNSLTTIKQISSNEFQAINCVMYLNLAKVIKMKSTNLRIDRRRESFQLLSYLQSDHHFWDKHVCCWVFLFETHLRDLRRKWGKVYNKTELV